MPTVALTMRVSIPPVYGTVVRSYVRGMTSLIVRKPVDWDLEPVSSRDHFSEHALMPSLSELTYS
jgi:hypothetical protein